MKKKNLKIGHKKTFKKFHETDRHARKILKNIKRIRGVRKKKKPKQARVKKGAKKIFKKKQAGKKAKKPQEGRIRKGIEKIFKKKKKERSTVKTQLELEMKHLNETITAITTRIETLEAKERANSELRNMTNNKIERLAEQIGEIRELFKVLSDEKKDMEVVINQTKALVETVHPGEINKKFMNITTKIITMSGKIELIQKKYEKFQKEFKKFSYKLKVFKGEDELLKIQKKLREEYNTINKIDHRVHMHASKFENHFIKIKEKVDAATTFLQDIQGLKTDLETLREELEEKKETFWGDESTKKIDELETTLEELVDLVTATFNNIKARQKKLEKAIGGLKKTPSKKPR